MFEFAKVEWLKMRPEEREMLQIMIAHPKYIGFFEPHFDMGKLSSPKIKPLIELIQVIRQEKKKDLHDRLRAFMLGAFLAIEDLYEIGKSTPESQVDRWAVLVLNRIIERQKARSKGTP